MVGHLLGTWKQPKCQSTDEWIRKMWHAHTLEYFSALKKEDIPTSAATWMNLGHIYVQGNKPDVEGQILYDSTDTWNLK